MLTDALARCATCGRAFDGQALCCGLVIYALGALIGTVGATLAWVVGL